MTETVFKVAAAQIAPVYLDRKKSVEKACHWIEKAGREGARLVVFPEAFIPGYPDWTWLVPNSARNTLDDLYAELILNAISIPDESTDELCRAAKSSGIHVAIGVNERNSEASNASLFNTLLHIDDKGNVLGKHRKLIATGGEKLIWSPGDGSTLQTFDTSIGRLGGIICWEAYMPLVRHAMYSWGTQILIVPTWDKSKGWLQSMQHIAREGGLFVISCAPAVKMSDIPERLDFRSLYPEGREWVNTGNSCIVGPDGKYVVEPVSEQESMLVAEIDLSDINRAKRLFDVAGNYARPDVFSLKINQTANLNIAAFESPD